MSIVNEAKVKAKAEADRIISSARDQINNDKNIFKLDNTKILLATTLN